MGNLVHFTPDTDPDLIVDVVRRDGAAIIDDVLTADQRSAVDDDLSPWVSSSPPGRDDFTGIATTRTGALVARCPAVRPVVVDPLILDLAGRFLAPYTNRIQLHLTQVIRLLPGQGEQALHRDRLAWGGYVPRSIEPQFNTIWALTDFTVANGATRVVLGSPAWDDDRQPADGEVTQAVMDAGSVLVYSGSVIHGGGANHSPDDRVGMNITYTLAWLRTEENQYLSCPPSVARHLEPELQELLGYTMGNYALGYWSDPDRVSDVVDLCPPELALGRKPRHRHRTIDGSGV
ncbi:MAG: phytanoyl-CoA dioxygenase family protein [Acidimicrobiales bacterium]